ncbi:MAG: hypothetical protein DDT30_02102 [Dehalococcoidia bacterium]|nr:hypothetical protein [Bacillota bacterium]
MFDKIVGAWLMIDGLGSFIVFREQHWFWQGGRIMRLVLGAILFWKGVES